LRFFACGHFLPDHGVGNPSGHTAAAAAVYGGLVAMILRGMTDVGRSSAPSSPVFSLLSSFGLEHLYRETIGRISATQE
jgi:hypothetical protein